MLHNIQAALEPVGGTLEDIACVNVFLVNMEHLQAVHEVRAQFWSDHYPASTLVQVAGLVHPDYLIEINATAIIPEPMEENSTTLHFTPGGVASAGKAFVFGILQRFFGGAFRVQTALDAPRLA